MPKKPKARVIKKKKEPSVEERRFGVLLEHMDGKFDLLVGGHEALHKRLDRVDETLADHGRMLGEHREILLQHTKKLDEHGRKLDEHSRKLDSHTEMIGGLAVDMAVVKSDLSIIKDELERKVGVADFRVLERRVVVLEKKVG